MAITESAATRRTETERVRTGEERRRPAWERDICGASTVAGSILVTGAMNRYPRRGTVSMKRGFSAESPKAIRSFRIAVFRPSSNPTYVSAGHNRACNCSRVTMSPGRSSRSDRTRKGCSCKRTFRPSLRTSPEPKSISKSPVRTGRRELARASIFLHHRNPDFTPRYLSSENPITPSATFC